MITGTFDFSTLGFLGEYTNPTISVDPTTVNIQDVEQPFSIQCNVLCVGDGYRISIRLTTILVNDFNYDQTQLIERVETRLNDFKI